MSTASIPIDEDNLMSNDNDICSAKTFHNVHVKNIIKQVYQNEDDAERINAWILHSNTYNNKYIAEAAMLKWIEKDKITTDDVQELRFTADGFFLSKALGVNDGDGQGGELDGDYINRCRNYLIQYTDTYVNKMKLKPKKNKIKATEFDIYKKLEDNDKVRCGLLLFRCGGEHESQLKQFKNEVWNNGVELNKSNSLWQNKCMEHFHEENFNFWVMANTPHTGWTVIDIIYMEDEKDETTVEVKRFYERKKYLNDAVLDGDELGGDEESFEDYLRSSLMNTEIATIITKDHKKYHVLETLNMEEDAWMETKKRANSDNNPGDTGGAGSDGVHKKVRND